MIPLFDYDGTYWGSSPHSARVCGYRHQKVEVYACLTNLRFATRWGIPTYSCKGQDEILPVEYVGNYYQEAILINIKLAN